MFSEIKKYKGILPLNNVFLALGGICMGVLFCNQLFITPTKLSEIVSLSIFLPLSILAILFLTIYFFLETKYNFFKWNNKFLIFGLIVGFTNFLAVLLIPTQEILFNKTLINTSTISKLYYIINGFLMALLPFLLIYVFPRKFHTRTRLNILLHLFILVIYIGVFYSLIAEFNSIKEMFSSGFKIAPGISSFFGQKNCFARSLLAGVFACFILYIRDHKFRWLFISIPLYLFIFLSMSKMTMFVAFIFTIALIIIKVISIAKRDRNNLILTSIIGSFILIIAAILITFTCLSQSGILFKIKNFINQTFENIKNTFGSRMIIWDCAFKLLKPWQYLIGYGFKGFGIAVHFVYANDGRLPAWENLDFIWTAHNSFIDQIGNGGIIYLLLILFSTIFIIYGGVKIYKMNKRLSVVLLCCIFSFIIYGFSDASYLFGDNTEFYITPIIVLPLIQELNLNFNKEEKKINNNIIKQGKTLTKMHFKSFILNLNKKMVIFEANCLKKSK